MLLAEYLKNILLPNISSELNFGINKLLVLLQYMLRI
jgi:hypothetical protein